MDKDTARLAALARVARWLSDVMSGADPMSGWTDIWHSGFADCAPEELAEINRHLGAAGDSGGSDEDWTEDGGHRWRLEAERVRLFETAASGVAAPPFGSWWMDGRLMGPSAGRVARMYQAFDLAPDAAPPDHISVELEFLQVLIQGQADPHRSQQVETLEETELRFLEESVIPWLGEFLEATKAASSTSFWPAVVAMIAHLARSELNRLRS